MERLYFLVNSLETNESTPVMCDGWMLHDGGWVEFYTGNMDHIVFAIPGRGFTYMQISKEEFDTAEAQAMESEQIGLDEEDFE